MNAELLDQLLGPKLESSSNFAAYISSAKADPDHPRNSVVRAMYHRGAKVVNTEGHSVRTHGGSAPDRGWVAARMTPYPDEQED